MSEDRALYWIDGAVCECGHEFEPWGIRPWMGTGKDAWPIVLTQEYLREAWVHQGPCGGRISFVNPRRFLITRCSTEPTLALWGVEEETPTVV